MKRLSAILLFLTVVSFGMRAQFYTGMSGLIHVPSADMYQEGDLRVGTYFLNKNFTPRRGFSYNGVRYNTMDFYISVTPFWWIEMGYAFTLMKMDVGGGKPKFNAKDRYLSLKVTPLREAKWWPSLSVGSNDVISTISRNENSGKSEYFRNFYAAATKHFDLWHQNFGLTLAYRHFTYDANSRWNGVVGGLAWTPGFAKDGRVIAEWDGCRVNGGIEYVLWRHLCLQAALIDCKYFTGGLCYKVNLF